MAKKKKVGSRRTAAKADPSRKAARDDNSDYGAAPAAARRKPRTPRNGNSGAYGQDAEPYSLAAREMPEDDEDYRAASGTQETESQNDDQEEAAAEEKRQRDSQIISQAKQRFNVACTADQKNREEALDDLKFLSGDQWPESIKTERDAAGKPCLTINRLPQFHRQVTNDQRQNRPAAQVNPVDDYGDSDTAEILQGLIRHIEYDSNADVAYDTASWHGSAHGRGYLYLDIQYESALSFNRVIKIKRCRNPFAVYMDPSAQEADYSDAKWGFIFERYSKDEYKLEFPNTQLAGVEEWSSIGDQGKNWIWENEVKVARYYYCDYAEETLCLMADGSAALESNLTEDELAQVQERRETQVPIIRVCRINAVEIIEETTVPGEWIPIIPVLGDEFDIDGEVMLQGIVRNAKDPQRMYNYWASKETETITSVPTAPWQAIPETIEGFEHLYKDANRKNYDVLPYKAIIKNGVLLPRPERNFGEPDVAGLLKPGWHRPMI
jgi:hypothetical protein